MTPKEKAQELVDRMHNVDAKDSAIVCVDEILSNSFLEPQLKRHIGSVEPLPIHLEYWFEVKKEIENL